MIFYNLFEAFKNKIEAVSLAAPNDSERVKVYLFDPDNLEELSRLSILVNIEVIEEESIELSRNIQEIPVLISIYYTLPKTDKRESLLKMETIRSAIYKSLVSEDSGFLLSDVPGNEALAGTENDQGLTGSLERVNIQFLPRFTPTKYATAETYRTIYRDDSAVKTYILKEGVSGVILDPRD